MAPHVNEMCAANGSRVGRGTCNGCIWDPPDFTRCQASPKYWVLILGHMAPKPRTALDPVSPTSRRPYAISLEEKLIPALEYCHICLERTLPLILPLLFTSVWELIGQQGSGPSGLEDLGKPRGLTLGKHKQCPRCAFKALLF